MINFIIGIDPGKHGAIVCLNKFNDLNDFKFIPKIGTDIDVSALVDIFKSISTDCMICIEDVHALYGSSSGATFDFGYTCGLLEGMITSFKLPYVFIKSKEWQKEMFQGVDPIYKPSKKKGKGTLETKKMAEVAVKRLYPQLDLYITEKGNISKNIHDGYMDALLIAGYGLRKFCVN